MRYIKKFEENRFKFKEGDKVIGVDVKVTDELCTYLENNVGTIIDIDDYITGYYYIVKYEYVKSNIRIEMESTSEEYNISKNDGAFPLHEEELRLATHSEIEIQELKKETDKYNL